MVVVVVLCVRVCVCVCVCVFYALEPRNEYSAFNKETTAGVTGDESIIVILLWLLMTFEGNKLFVLSQQLEDLGLHHPPRPHFFSHSLCACAMSTMCV